MLINPLPPTGELLSKLHELVDEHGPVKTIVLPTASGLEHKISLPSLARYFPNATLWIAPGQWSFPFQFPLDWLGSSSLAFTSIVIVDIWHWTPFVVLLLLAGLESLPTDVYEAARVDGTSGWNEIIYITIPLMIPTIIVTMVFRFILSFKVFDEIYLLTQGGPGTSTEVISFSIYETFFESDNMGLGSVMSVVSLFVVSLLIIIVLNVIRRVNKYAN